MEAVVETLVPVIGEQEFGEGEQHVAVAAKPRGVAAIEGDDDGPLLHVGGVDAEDARDDRDQLLVLADSAVAVGVVAHLGEVER